MKSHLFVFMEVWKHIKYYPCYEISNYGNIKKNSINLKPTVNSVGYYVIGLRKNKITKLKSIHRLVALSFITNPDNKRCVNHIDGDKLNNNDWNLEWNTYSENNQHAYDNKLKIPPVHIGLLNPSAKLTEANVIDIRRMRNNISQVDIAKIYNVHKSLISLILNRKIWTHI